MEVNIAKSTARCAPRTVRRCSPRPSWRACARRPGASAGSRRSPSARGGGAASFPGAKRSGERVAALWPTNSKRRISGSSGPRTDSDIIQVQFNPTELAFSKAAQLAEIAIPGLDAPIQQFVRGQARKADPGTILRHHRQRYGTPGQPA